MRNRHRPVRSVVRRYGALAIALAWLAAADVVAAEAAQAEQTPSERGKLLPALAARVPLEPGPPAPDLSELCDQKPGGLAWIDRMQAGLYRRTCLMVAGFDGFFGNARFDDQYEATHGSLAVGTLWDERDHWDPSVRFRVSVRLPQLSARANAFVGRGDPEEYVTELRDDFDTLPRQFGDAEDDAVLLGLGYRQPGTAGGHFDASVGAKLDWPPAPYAKVAYFIAQPLLERNLLRFRETLFWRDEDGFGSTTRVDVERLLTEDLLVRWTGLGTYSQETEGLRWFSNLTLYQNLGDRRALAYQVGASGESENDVSLTDYGLRVIYRRSVYRDWLILELRSSVGWPQETLSESREANWGAGVALEMQFGERTRE